MPYRREIVGGGRTRPRRMRFVLCDSCSRALIWDRFSSGFSQGSDSSTRPTGKIVCVGSRVARRTRKFGRCCRRISSSTRFPRRSELTPEVLFPLCGEGFKEPAKAERSFCHFRCSRSNQAEEEKSYLPQEKIAKRIRMVTILRK